MPDRPQAKRALGPLSNGSKDRGTHNAPLFLSWKFVLSQLGKILCFKPRVRKFERTWITNTFIEHVRRCSMQGHEARGKHTFS